MVNICFFNAPAPTEIYTYVHTLSLPDALPILPFIEARYRTGERRAVMGESLAGLFVIDTLVRQADLFHDYVAVSPSLWWDDSRQMRTASQSQIGRAHV